MCLFEERTADSEVSDIAELYPRGVARSTRQTGFKHINPRVRGYMGTTRAYLRFKVSDVGGNMQTVIT